MMRPQYADRSRSPAPLPPTRRARARAAQRPGMPRWAWWLLALAVATPLAAPLAVRAQDRAELDRTQVIGNRELPKVLYIVPWKKPAALPLLARPPASVLDEPPTPLDREVLRRQLRLEGELRERNPTPPRGATP